MPAKINTDDVNTVEINTVGILANKINTGNILTVKSPCSWQLYQRIGGKIISTPSRLTTELEKKYSYSNT